MYVTLEIFSTLGCSQYLITWTKSSSKPQDVQCAAADNTAVFHIFHTNCVFLRGFGKKRLPKLLPSRNNNAQSSKSWALRCSTAHARVSQSSPRCCLCLWLLRLNPFWSQWGSWHHRPGHPAWKSWKRVYVTQLLAFKRSRHDVLIISCCCWRWCNISILISCLVFSHELSLGAAKQQLIEEGLN